MRRFEPERYLEHQKRQLSRLHKEVASLEEEITRLTSTLEYDIARAKALKESDACPIHNGASYYVCGCRPVQG